VPPFDASTGGDVATTSYTVLKPGIFFPSVLGGVPAATP